MPTYDYLCGNCGHAFEEFQSITAGPLRKCSECGKMKLKRLIGAGSGIIFKGSGFYQTDYRTEDYKKSVKNDKPPTKTDAKKKSSDTKAAKPADKNKPDTKKKKTA